MRVFAWFLCAALLIAGCDGRNSPGPSARGPGNRAGEVLPEELFDWAIDNLDRLEQFGAAQIPQQMLRTLSSLPRGVADWPGSRDPLLLSCPQPEMLGQIVDRLNQWARSQPPAAGWQRDRLVDQLPEPLARLPMVQDLGRKEFSSYDGFVLREALWLREIAARVRGETTDELSAAGRLFDWTVRNIQLEASRPDRLPQLPWETLFFGRGTALERAWVFLLLARQEHLDAFLLAVPDPDAPQVSPAGPWWVAVLIAGRLYLFEPALGLPIPAPGGLRLGGGGTLEIQPATLDEVAADDALLRRLDLEPENPYPLSAADLKQMVAYVEAAPWNLSARMMLLQGRLAGKRTLKLVASPAAQAARLQDHPQIAEVRLWSYPYEVVLRRQRALPDEIRSQLLAWLPYYTPWPWDSVNTLARARVLHLKGRFEDEQGAISAYQELRFSEQQLELLRKEMLADFEAAQRPAPATDAAQQPLVGIPDLQTAAREVELRIQLLRRITQDAGYWLGLITLERGNYAAAIDWLAVRTLEASPDGLWTAGAHYNLARAYEASGRPREAISEYLANTGAPGHYGEFLRARWLDQLLAQQQAAPVDGALPRAGEDEPPAAPVLEPSPPGAPALGPPVPEPPSPEPPTPEPPAPEPPSPEAPSPGSPTPEPPSSAALAPQAVAATPPTA